MVPDLRKGNFVLENLSKISPNQAVEPVTLQKVVASHIRGNSSLRLLKLESGVVKNAI